MADGDDYAYLSGLSAHPGRSGDTSNFNPRFAASLAGAIRQARGAGLNVGLESGYRDPGQTGSAYDAGGNSSHTYGLAADINGLDGPNGRLTNEWAQIAQANGLHNPYGVGDNAEFNHWQLPPQPLEQNPQLLASLKAAKATGNMSAVWNAYNTGTGGTGSPPAQGLTVNTSGPDFYAAAMQHESGGKNIPNAAGADAGGYFQFTSPTWAGIRAARPDLNLPPNVMAASPAQQTAAYHELTRQNVAALQGANLPINDKNVFMGSFLGGGGATKFLGAMNQNPDANAAALFPAEAKANPTVFYNQGQPRSLQQVYALQTGSFGSGNTTGFGTNLNTTASGPIDPSAQARGSVVNPPLPADGTTPTATASAPPGGGLGAAIAALNQGTGQGGKGPSALDTAAKMFDPPQQQAPPPAPIPQAPPLQRFDPGAQQLMMQLLARNAKPLSWGTAPFGSTGTGLQPAGQQASPQGDLSQLSQWETWQRMQQAGLGSPVPPGVPGTTLNSSGGSYV